MDIFSRFKIGRILVVWLINLGAIALLAFLSSGFTIQSWRSGVVFIAVLGIINALLWPFLARVTLIVTVLTLGLFSLVLNSILVLLAVRIVPGVQIEGLPTVIFVIFGLSWINALFSSLFAIDDKDSYYRNVIRKAARKKAPVTDDPGVIFLEIDGLAYAVLLRALDNGYMPNLARWLRDTHKLVHWETDLSSATPASQAGILLGDNDNMPAFRWYDRGSGKVISMGSPRDAFDLENEKGSDDGLLRDGVSVSNMFSGGASNNILTSSRLLARGGIRNQTSLYYFFSSPYNFTRTLALAVVDIFHELADSIYQKRHGVEPRVHRGGRYPLVRAATTVLLRDISTHTIIGEMFAGVGVLYATFVGYDEVAHHAGVERSQAMYVLREMDKQIAKMEQATEDAPRPYHLVILSDHGQSQGTTFRKRNGKTIERFIQQFVGQEYGAESVGSGEEGIARVNALLTEITRDQDKFLGRAARRILRRNTKDGLVDLEKKSGQEDGGPEEKELVVLASGNLATVYFSHFKKRLSYEEINRHFPRLIENILENQDIGFIMVDSESLGALVLGREGTKELRSGNVTGIDPLAVFHASNAEQSLLRSNSFDNAPDIFINSAYDPDTDQIVPFEEFVGSHGGLGGNQNRPFLLYPKVLEPGQLEDIFGAEHLHRVLSRWTLQRY